MGCGKTSVGTLLASKLGILFFDLDAIIEEEEQLSIAEIFAEKGEIYFRKKEHQVVQILLKNEMSFVLSLGGGTPCYYNNHELISKANCFSFYLKGTPETLSQNLIDEVKKRPLLAHIELSELPDFIAKDLFERSFYYHQAKQVIAIDNKTIEELVDEVIGYLR